jgi:hypothetical protein
MAPSSPILSATTSASARTSPPLRPEQIADNIIFALDVHETQLSELRKNPEELWQLTRDAVRAPLRGYTAVPLALAKRDRFYAVMKALCDSQPKTAFE